MIYIIRIIVVTLWVFLASTIAIIVGIFRPMSAKNTKLFVDLLSFGTKILGIQIEVRGKEFLQHDKACVYICNHQENMDIFTGSHVFASQTVTVGKNSLKYVPFFGQIFWLGGNLLIDRNNKQKAFEVMDVAQNAIIKKNLSIWIMPEGTRSKGKGLLPFKKGAFYTAIKAQVNIVPITISSYKGKLNLNKFHSGKVIVEVHPPIVTKDKQLEDLREIKNSTYEFMKEAISKIDREV